ncbi:MAG: 16S rRNA (cytidine(1402)-2'-O)-methyltransferase [Jaaginema sp. PMC 1079.18]|nr:16S rRNA (cytidine(1402)-2'-O)-methyltransferase [Jaaginema sp. PMC 1080.18]MEC4852498.1 16S rRNA (cytidine(1402)-2'-O)-methyltransferase [Jaaginema sp. PMC 1079.18]MEC4868707.1 16S rRNA (cytidine(1402)-2'-O)-methyltransferase [Jaaginema sp. PMC 1078.18]
MVNPKTLYLVGTPLGNLEDMTFRAIRVLKEVDMIAAEDTRHTGKLLQHFQIETPQISYYEHNAGKRTPELIQKLEKGSAIALVTDAGMPAISDPGYELVKACATANITIVPIPGATAAMTALAASGIESDRFIFEGFLPTKNKERQARLQQIQRETRSLIFYEAPHRILRTLTDFAEVLGEDRAIVLGRELTKMHEEFWRGTIGDALIYYQENLPKGEFTIVAAGGSIEAKMTLTEDQLKLELKKLMAEGMSRSQASRHLAQVTAIPRRQLYQLALQEIP